jgi:spermidine synthase
MLLSRPMGALQDAPAWARAGLTGTLLVVATLAPPLRFVDVPPGSRILSFEEGAMAAVSVVEDAEGVARLHINNRQQEGSSASFDADARQALLPLLLHPAPGRALFLGLGTGVTASAAAADPLLRVDAVELLPEVIAASAHFRSSATPMPRLLTSDARRFVRASDERYDVIVSDNFHPARSGSGSLYTVEHFLAVRGRLTAQGLFCQWLPLHQLDLASLRSIVAAFVAAYPNGFAMLATHSLQTPVLGLVSRADDGRFDMPALRARLASADPALGHARLGLGDPLAVFGSFVAGPAALAKFSAGAPVNSDDHPVVSYAAPRITYAPDSLPRDRLLALLDQLSISPPQLVRTPAPDGVEGRLAAYWMARDAFLRAGREVRPTTDVRQMLAQVQQPLLDVLRTSPDFAPAYDPLLRMAGALAGSDREAARRLLAELDRMQPSRPEARLLLQKLADTPR